MIQQDRNNAAVSETLGYILLFAIVTLSMGFIYAVGYPMLQSNIDANIFESAEQSFIVLQSDMDRVAFDQKPVTITRMKLQNSELSVNNGSSMTITYDSNPPMPVNTGNIEFEKDKKKIIYEMGSILESYPPDAMIMVSKPPIYVTDIDNTTVTTIGLISVNGEDSASGKGIATMTFTHNLSNMSMSSSPTDVEVNINSNYAPVWEKYFEDIGFTVTNTTSSGITAHMNNTMLILSRHVVDVDIS